MRILEKMDFRTFRWLNFDNLKESDCYRFEIYFEDNASLSEISSVSYMLFNPNLNDIFLGQFGVDSEWGDFCLDTWDINKDRYDYSLEGKSGPTLRYLKMLKENEVNPEYTGFCKLLNWYSFLEINLDCVLNHIAPYSTVFYNSKFQYMFYFHHSKSIGVYYKHLNEGVNHILNKIKAKGLNVINTNDKRVFNYFN